MKYAISKEKDTTTFSIKVENVDYSNTEELIIGLKNIMSNDGNRFVIDISKVKFVDSTGLNLITTAERLQLLVNRHIKILNGLASDINSEEIAIALFKARNT
jgi:anti-anti-sigma regulatory factor